MTTGAEAGAPPVVQGATADALRDLHARMVDRAKANGAIRSAAVEAAFRATPRHVFLPGVGLEQVYSGSVIVTRSDDKGQPISSSSEIAIMAAMLEDLDVRPGHRVLEIGTGTGYNAALLDRLVGGDGGVVTIELDPEIAAQAREHLAVAGHDRVRVEVGDGYGGYPARAPYDRIIATASVRDMPRAWLDQLVEDGRLTVPLRLRGNAQMVVTFRRRGETLQSVALVPGGFMALRGERAWNEPAFAIEGDWEASLAGAEERDSAILAALLHAAPAIEPLREVPWQVVSMMGLLEPDWISVRHGQRQIAWSGIYDRPSRSLALMWSVPVPMRVMTWILLVYGPPPARDRLLRLIDDVASITVNELRLEAVPIDRSAPSGDVVVAGENFRYAISRAFPTS